MTEKVARNQRESNKKIQMAAKNRKTQGSPAGESVRRTPAGRKLAELRKKKAAEDSS